jgi:hypothetical protein
VEKAGIRSAPGSLMLEPQRADRPRRGGILATLGLGWLGEARGKWYERELLIGEFGGSRFSLATDAKRCAVFWCCGGSRGAREQTGVAMFR